MMTQEDYVREVLALHHQGWSIKEIAEQTEYHPATVSKWLKAGGPPATRKVAPQARVVDERWAAAPGPLQPWMPRHSPLR